MISAETERFLKPLVVEPPGAGRISGSPGPGAAIAPPAKTKAQAKYQEGV